MRILLICVLLIVVQLGLSVYLVPVHYSRQQIDDEFQSIKSEFGEKFAHKVVVRANRWIKLVFPTRNAKLKESRQSYYYSLDKRPNNLEKLRRKAYQLPANLEFGLYQIFLRFSLLSYWAPVLLIVYLVFLLEGLSRRKLNKLKFSYSAVERNRLLIRLLGLLLIVMSLCVVSVIAVPAIILLLCCLMLSPVIMLAVASGKRSL